MSIGSILSWIVCGLVVGLCARLLVPGRQVMSLSMTMLLGIVGALAGGFLYSLIRERLSSRSHWPATTGTAGSSRFWARCSCCGCIPSPIPESG